MASENSGPPDRRVFEPLSSLFRLYRCQRCGNVWYTRSKIKCPACSKCKSRKTVPVPVPPEAGKP